MSKAALKKELLTLEREQLIEVILTAYASNKAVKDYFDFFMQPDADALFDKTCQLITREVYRGRARKSTARISRIRSAIKNFISYNPGDEYVLRLYEFIIAELVEQQRHRYFTDTLIRGTLNLLNDMLKFANSSYLFDTALAAFERITRTPDDNSKYFRAYLRKNVEMPQPDLIHKR